MQPVLTFLGLKNGQGEAVCGRVDRAWMRGLECPHTSVQDLTWYGMELGLGKKEDGPHSGRELQGVEESKFTPDLPSGFEGISVSLGN